MAQNSTTDTPAETLSSVPTPQVQAEGVQLAANTATQAPAAAVETPSVKAETYQVVVKAPEDKGMLAYLVGPGAEIVLKNIDLGNATLAEEGGNLRISLPGGGEILLLDYVSSAKASNTVVVTDEGTLPAQKLLQALEVAEKQADVEPAAGPQAGGEGGGIIPPTILGTGVGEGSGIFSSVIGPYALPIAHDQIITREFPTEFGEEAPLPPFNNVIANDDVIPLVRNDADRAVDSVTYNVKANDVDPQGDAFSVTRIVSGPAIGSVVLNADGTVTYTADASVRGAYTTTFTYEVTDSKGATDTAVVTVNVGADFNNVDAVNDTATLTRNTANNAVDSLVIDVKTNDTDPQGDAFSVTRIVSGPAIGSVVLNADGTVTYTADASVRGAYTTTFTYEVTDSRGATDTATVTVNVGADFNSVIANDDVIPLVRNDANRAVDSVTYNVKANDTDPQGDAFSVTRIVSGPAIGSVVLNADGTVTYTADASHREAYTTTFTYEVTDSRGATDTATVTVNVGADFVQNLPPFAHNDTFSTSVNTALTLDPSQLLVNDTDPENDTLTIVSVQSPEHGTVTIVGGKVVFTPADDFTGTGSFSYTVTDGHGNTSTADVIIQIDPTFPGQNTVIAADDAVTVPEAGRSVTVNVLANDTDPQGDALVPGSVRIISGPDQGTATVNPDGTISYQSVGRDGYFTSLVYEVSDTRGARDTATLTIEVKAAVNTVDAIDDTGEIIPAGASKVFNVTANDIDPQGDAFAITRIVSGPEKGTATFNAATGEILYQSVESDVGYDVHIVYEITDARGAKDEATLIVRVEPVNNTSAVDDTADLLAGQSVNIKVLNNDFDQQGDAFHLTRIVEQPRLDDGTLRGTVTINPDGTITYTDAAGARDAAVVEFKYEITDARGATDIAVVRVTIGTAPNGVDANNDTLTVNEDSPRADITSQLRANDFDPQGDTFTITAITPIDAAKGTLELVGGHVFFTPAANFNGPVNFTYTIIDAKGATDTAQVTINVQEVPDGLNAGDDTFTTPFNTNLAITPAQLLANDYDPDGTVLGSANIISFTQPLNGTLTRNPDGSFTYNPDDTFRGTDSFTYTIRDAQGETDTATVTIRVADPLPQDNPVDAVDDTVILNPGQTKTVNVLTNDSAPDGGLAYVGVVGTLPAGIVDHGNGVFSYSAPWNQTGQVLTFQYQVRDVDGDTDIATVTFRVEGPVNSVDAVDDVATLVRNTANNAVDSLVINVKANDVDPQGDAFSVTRIVSGPAIGSVVLNADGTVTYTADASVRGAYTTTFTYEVTDSKGATDTATVTVNVGADFNSVDAVDDTVNLTRDAANNAVDSLVIDVKANDRDPQNDNFSVTRIVSGPAIGSVVLNADGTVTYTADPAHREAYTTTFTYEVTDSKGATDTATVTVNVGADFNSVIANDDNATVTAGQSVDIDVKANDRDPQGDSFSVTRIVSGPSVGTASINADGTIHYQAVGTTAYNTSLVYEITDSRGATSQATLTVHANQAPAPNNVVAVDDSFTILHSLQQKTYVPADIVGVINKTIAANAYTGVLTINPTKNDYDPQGDSFSVTKIVSVSAGTATLNANGTINYKPTSKVAFGRESADIVYEITDSHGATDTATIHINYIAFTVTNSPLVIDLDGDGIQMSSYAESHAMFDLNNDGVADKTAWFTGHDALLVHDDNNNGTVDGLSELFGGENLNGFVDLAAYADSNGDGIIDAKDPAFASLKLWIDANSDGVTQQGELITLDDLGITSIDTRAGNTSIHYQDSYIDTESVVHTTNGDLAIYDAWFKNTQGYNTGVLASEGDDILVYAKTAEFIDGGQGFDTMKVMSASDISINHDVALKGVEAINLHNDGIDHLSLNVNDVLNISDNGILAIKGDAVDEVNLSGDFTQGANVTQGGTSFASYNAANGAQVLVELGVTVHEEHNTPTA